MKKIWINIAKAVGFLSFGSVILYLVFRSVSKSYMEDCLAKGNVAADCKLIDKIWLDFQEANYWWLAGIVLVFMLSNVSRAIRWQMLFKPLGHQIKFLNSFFAIMLGYFANLGLPRAGEFVRGSTLTAYEGVAFEKSMGTIVVDRIMDFICLAVIIVLALVFESELIADYLGGMTDGAGSKGIKLGIFAAIVVGGIYITWRMRERLSHYTIYKKIEKLFIGFIEGIGTVRKLDKPVAFVFHTIAIWVCYYLMTYLCFFAYEPTAFLGWQEGLVIFLMGAIGMIIPSPGGMGSYHAMLMAGLAIYGVTEYDGFSYANLIFFTVQIFGNILFGIMALIVLPLYNGKKKTIDEPIV